MDTLYNEVLSDIITIMTDTELSEPFYEAVLKRLISFGYELKEDDGWTLCFCLNKVETSIKNYCNISTIPGGLFPIIVDRSCGEFLFQKLKTDKLDGFDFETAVKQVQTGDTNITFENSEDTSKKLNLLISHLMSKGEGELVCYRKIRW